MSGKVFLLATCLLAAGCASNNVTQTGVVTDATMNTVTILTGSNQTMSFSTLNADRSELKGLRLGDRVNVRFSGPYEPGLEIQKISTAPIFPLLFEKAIRLQSVSGSSAVYVLFTDEDRLALIFDTEGRVIRTLEHRKLPNGLFAWNVADDDTWNLRKMPSGLWTITQRTKTLFTQSTSATDESLGQFTTLHYEGLLPAADCPGIRYELFIRHRTHSGDGTFLLNLTYLEAENGKDMTFSYLGRRYTLKGSADNENAIVWQCRSDNGQELFNFLVENQSRRLTLLTDDFKRIDSPFNYSLEKKN